MTCTKTQNPRRQGTSENVKLEYGLYMKQWREKKTRDVGEVDFEETLKPDWGDERYWVSSGEPWKDVKWRKM